MRALISPELANHVLFQIVHIHLVFCSQIIKDFPNKLAWTVNYLKIIQLWLIYVNMIILERNVEIKFVFLPIMRKINVLLL